MLSKALSVFAALTLSGGCSAAPPVAPAATAHSILQSSTPADGSTVQGPLDSLELRFSPPARLNELAITGSDGLTMPMMLTPVGEVAYYSIPLSGLGPGSYSASWQATVAGNRYRGQFNFTVR